MNAYRLDSYPTQGMVANAVTFLVSAWFLVAGAAILSDPASTYTQRHVAKAPAATELAAIQPAAGAIAPEARLTIVVEASRASANL
jgi:hypothetical protein